MAASDSSAAAAAAATADVPTAELMVDQSQWFAVEPRKDCPHITKVAPVLDFESKIALGWACSINSPCMSSYPALPRLRARWRELGVPDMLTSGLQSLRE